MSKLKSSRKALRSSKRKAAFNKADRIKYREAKKEVFGLVKDGKKTEATKKLQNAYSLIDKAAKKHVLHKNTAARYKSALAKAI
ncbi:30S ribosomal protein S20 [Candidatus Dojkabacteria bacterium]|nr:30S ribosomal protein S20 [Candidatus Dojkabacteria bacterium]